MDFSETERMIEGFMNRHPGKNICMECVIQHIPLSIKEEQVKARHVLLTSEWGKRAQVGICSWCKEVKETW